MWGFSGNRRWVYVKRIAGTFQRAHRVTGLMLQALLFAAPWIRIGGLPAVRIDLPGRKLLLLGWAFPSSEVFSLVLIALLAAFSLFFATALFGRLWCGYACPQSVFLEEWVRPVETFIEGDRVARMRRDQGPWTFDRTWRKAAKWTMFALMAIVLSMTVMSWFAGAPEIWVGSAGPVDYTLVGVFSFGLFLNWAWFREQLCNYLCPYARFQGALADDHSLVITYDRARGEPRGRGKAAAVAGNCVDCNKCVDVCPAGIDIRDGYQLECIACARCVDACETVMPKLGFPSLVRYSTVAIDAGGKPRLLRRRTAAYSALLAVVAGALVVRLARHEPLEVTVNRSPGSMFVVDPDGAIRNLFLVHVTNNDPARAHLYVVSVHGLVSAQMASQPLELAPLASHSVPLTVRMPSGGTVRNAPFTVRVSEVGDDPHAVDRVATFTAPGLESP